MHHRACKRISLPVFCVLIVALAGPAAGLTAEEIEKSIRRGEDASEAKAVPLFFKAGGVKAPSDMVRDLILPLSGAGYDFLVGSCRQWIENTTFRARVDGSRLDREAIFEKCLECNELRIAVVREGSNNIAWGVLTLSYPTPARPIRSMWLIVDNEKIEPASTAEFDKYGEGNGYVVYDADVINGANRIWIVATIEGRSDHLKVELRRKTIRRLFRTP